MVGNLAMTLREEGVRAPATTTLRGPAVARRPSLVLVNVEQWAFR